MPSEIKVNKSMLSNLNLTCTDFPKEANAANMASLHAAPVWNFLLVSCKNQVETEAQALICILILQALYTYK